MGVGINSNRAMKTALIKNDEFQKRQHFLQKESKEANKEIKNIYTSDIDSSSINILANYARAGLNLKRYNFGNNIPNGHSRFDYKGGRFDVYRNDDEYRSQFVYPENFDMDEFFEQFPYLQNQRIIKTDNTKSSIDSINGKIDETVSQSSLTGDCWLIASVKSLADNEKGKEIIKNSITVNDDNSVTVSFNGIGASYTLSEYEIENYDTDSNTYDSYSNGDNDMLVLELAVEKLWKDIKKGKVTLDTDNENINYTGEYSGIEDGGLPSQMIYYLTGVESEEYYNEDVSDLSESKVYEALQNALNLSNAIINIGIYDDVHSCTLIDGSTYSIDLGSGGHALAVTNVTSDTVTFVNPWDTSIEYCVSWEEFASLGIGYISVSDISKAVEKDTQDLNYDTYSWDYNVNPYHDFNYYRRNDNWFDFNYREDAYEIDFDADNNEIKNDDFRPDFKNDEKFMPNSNYSYSQTNIMELFSKFLDIFNLLFSFLKA